MPSVRQVQVQNLMIQEISDMLYKDLKDPRLGFITITAAEITRDLRYAKVFVSIMGSEDDCAKGLAALRSAAGRIRGEFTRRAHLRVAPEIDFRADEGIPRGARIFELLHNISTEPTTHESPVPPGDGRDP
ncbi:MAG: 30S ribosome-binding factor RbfA [Armatimonadetes bacterium]|jgi:ribosome-binding factor A|nr:30S ribosome-binding factor RbfA [Armatimonadota bacterium]